MPPSKKNVKKSAPKTKKAGQGSTTNTPCLKTRSCTSTGSDTVAPVTTEHWLLMLLILIFTAVVSELDNGHSQYLCP